MVQAVAASQLLTYILIGFTVRDHDLNRRHLICAVRLHRGSHAVLQQFQQHVGDVAGDVGKVQVRAAVDGHLGGVPVRARADVRSAVDGLSISAVSTGVVQQFNYSTVADALGSKPSPSILHAGPYNNKITMVQQL
jgi:hypothetical protein